MEAPQVMAILSYFMSFRFILLYLDLSLQLTFLCTAGYFPFPFSVASLSIAHICLGILFFLSFYE